MRVAAWLGHSLNGWPVRLRDALINLGFMFVLGLLLVALLVLLMFGFDWRKRK